MSDRSTPAPEPSPGVGTQPPRRPGEAGGFEVNPDQLYAHGRETAMFSDRVAYAKDAAGQVVTADIDMAYGMFGKVIGVIAKLQEVEGVLIQAIRRCNQNLEFPVDQLPKSAGDYVDMDTNGAKRFKDIR